MCKGAPDACRPGLGRVLTAGVVALEIGLNVVANKVANVEADLAKEGVPQPPPLVLFQAQAEATKLRALAVVPGPCRPGEAAPDLLG